MRSMRPCWNSALPPMCAHEEKRPRPSASGVQSPRALVVERAHSWLNRFRRLLVRWEKKPENYLAFLHFGCGLLAFRAAGLFG